MCKGLLTVSNLVFGNFTLFFYVQAAHEEVPFALETSWGGDADFRGWWWGQSFYAGNPHSLFFNLFHLDVRDVGCDVAIVVERTLDFVEQL